ncbi:hypothetical protein QUF70_04385 [Desulfobacterales bacterium HSG17]|nr:hypothetical protein [Desulfobacterales bacterium HSG17]
MLLKTTLIGKKETFKSLGIDICDEIKLETLISNLKKQFELEYYDTEDIGQEILEGLKAVRDGRIDNRDWRMVLKELDLKIKPSL